MYEKVNVKYLINDYNLLDLKVSSNDYKLDIYIGLKLLSDA